MFLFLLVLGFLLLGCYCFGFLKFLFFRRLVVFEKRYILNRVLTYGGVC